MLLSKRATNSSLLYLPQSILYYILELVLRRGFLNGDNIIVPQCIELYYIIRTKCVKHYVILLGNFMDKCP